MWNAVVGDSGGRSAGSGKYESMMVAVEALYPAFCHCYTSVDSELVDDKFPRTYIVVVITAGKFSIQSELSASITQAFGLAPPNDEPGEISINSHFR